jgi:predicted small metal-binding protein
MSDEDRKMKIKVNEDAEESTEEVDAHYKPRHAADEPSEDAGDDVQAHVKPR